MELELDLRDSQKLAHIRFSQLAKRLTRDEALRSQYVGFMEEYQRLGHMIEIPKQEKHAVRSFLPKHAVYKQQSTTTKQRVVFNASQETPSGKSLNDVLLTGPSIQNNLTNILMRWRTQRYVIATDIEKMYQKSWGFNVSTCREGLIPRSSSDTD